MITVQGLTKQYISGGGWFGGPASITHAVTDISFDIPEGQTLGLVGESGCGKSTLGKTLLRLLPSTAGQVRMWGESVLELNGRPLQRFRKHMQMVFQDPYASLNPKMRVGTLVGEPLLIHEPNQGRSARKTRVLEMLDQVGLTGEAFQRFPHEFSGGQRQRIGIARAMILKPKFVVCDEPVSALDVSVQSQILNLLKDLQAAYGLTLLFISHDLRVVQFMSHEVLVMYLGRPMEQAASQTLYENPLHPYTQSLLSAIPDPKIYALGRPKREVLKGDVPSPKAPPSGCVFRTRCPIAEKQCAESVPVLREVRPGHKVACHLVE